jgi:hypothetical protein
MEPDSPNLFSAWLNRWGKPVFYRAVAFELASHRFIYSNILSCQHLELFLCTYIHVHVRLLFDKGQYSFQSMTNNKKGAWKLLNYGILRLNVTNDAICKRKNNSYTIVIIFLGISVLLQGKFFTIIY